MKTTQMTENAIMKSLDMCYAKAVEGLPKMKNSYELAEEYLRKYEDAETAARRFSKMQIAKCSTSGFLAGLGGIVTLPVSIPANLAVSWIVQLQMISTIAVMGGYDPQDDEVKTLCYACLAGKSVSDIAKESGIVIGKKLAAGAIQKIPGSLLTKINQAVGFRMLTKFGSTGAINLGKAVPVVGGFVGGGFDFASTRIASKYAIRTFIHGNL